MIKIDNDTGVYRQIHTSFYKNKRVASVAFLPKSEDNYNLSVYDGSKITPELAWQHYTVQKRRASVGVLAVTVNECMAEQLTPRPDTQEFEEHAIIEFGVSRDRQARRKARILRNLAVDRGWRFLNRDYVQ